MARSSEKTKRSWRNRAEQTIVRAAAWSIASGLVLLACCLAAQRLWHTIAQRPEFRLDSYALVLTECPEWVRQEPMRAELNRCLGSSLKGKSIFDDVANVARQRLEACPWLVRVTSVRRRLPNSLVIRAEFRKPAGILAFQGQRYLVDLDGRVLPDELFRRPPDWADEQTPIILDTHLPSLPSAAVREPEPSVAVGARLCQELRQSGLFSLLEVTAIDVSGVGRRTAEPDIVLRTASGAIVKWGESCLYKAVPGLSLPPFHVPDHEKLRMLASQARINPGLSGIAYLDLRFRNQVVVARAPGPALAAAPPSRQAAR